MSNTTNAFHVTYNSIPIHSADIVKHPTGTKVNQGDGSLYSRWMCDSLNVVKHPNGTKVNQGDGSLYSRWMCDSCYR